MRIPYQADISTMVSSRLRTDFNLAILLGWFNYRFERLGQIIENDIPVEDREGSREIIYTLKVLLHPEIEKLWSGTYREAHSIRLDILGRLGLFEDEDRPRVCTWLFNPRNFGGHWGVIKRGFPVLLEDCKLDYRFTKKNLPRGRAWIPDRMKYAVPRRETALAELDASGQTGEDEVWVTGPRTGQWRPQETESCVHIGAAGLLFANGEQCAELPRRRSLLVDSMESDSYPLLVWPSREADYFNRHAAYEPGRRQAAKSFLRCLAQTLPHHNARHIVRGVGTVRQMLVAAVNAAKRQTSACSLLNAIIKVNIAFAIDRIGYCHLQPDPQEWARRRFAEVGLQESSGQPESEADSSSAEAKQWAPSSTCDGIRRELGELWGRPADPQW